MAVIVGTGGKDSLVGTSAVDTLEGKGGDDKIQGGEGEDYAVFSGNFSDYSFTYDPDTHWYTVVDSVSGRDGTDIVRTVEFFRFAGGLTKTWGELVPHQGDGFVLRGDATSNVFYGGSGLDKLYGLDGNDTLYGNGADDLVLGGAGDDYMTGDGGDDTIDGGPGVDTVGYQWGFSNYSITYDPITRNFRIVDIRPGSAFNHTGTDLVRNVEWFTFAGISRELIPNAAGGGIIVNGGSGNDLQMQGISGGDKLYGNGGHDNLKGYAGDDFLSGGDGDDGLFPGIGNDIVEGGSGHDEAVFAGAFANYTITYDATTRQYRLVDTVGSEGTDLVRGVEGFYFGDGYRTWGELVPHQGDGLLLRGDTGGNLLQGGTGLDRLYGYEGNDALAGLGADDILVGGAGNDTLSGGAGVDQLQGQSGMDTYVFDAPLTGEMDNVVDFATAFDTFQLDALVFSALLPGALNANAFQSAASTEALSTDARVLFDTASGNLYYDADGMGGAGAVAFANISLTGLVGTLTHADFVVS
jgi:Ca2+-binding RTX toxin-like protein